MRLRRRRPRRTYLALLVVSLARSAEAQVQTNELGVRVGYLEELGGSDLSPAFPTSGSAPAFGLFYSRYLESGFALSVGVDVGIQEVPSRISASSTTCIAS